MNFRRFSLYFLLTVLGIGMSACSRSKKKETRSTEFVTTQEKQGQPGPRGQKGDKGDKGDPGIPGRQGTPGTPGRDGCVIKNQTPTEVILDCNGQEVIIPKGQKGDKGDKGDPGDPGPTGPKGDKGDAGDSGPKGDQGDPGPAGPKGDKGDPGSGTPSGEKPPGEPSPTDPKPEEKPQEENKPEDQTTETAVFTEEELAAYLTWKSIGPEETQGTFKSGDGDKKSGHGGACVKVFVNEEAAKLYHDSEKASPPFSSGSIIAMAAFEAGGKQKQSVLFMKKMPSGYNPPQDWAYAIAEAAGGKTKISEQGKVSLCIECHLQAKDYDYAQTVKLFRDMKEGNNPFQKCE